MYRALVAFYTTYVAFAAQNIGLLASTTSQNSPGWAAVYAAEKLGVALTQHDDGCVDGSTVTLLESVAKVLNSQASASIGPSCSSMAHVIGSVFASIPNRVHIMPSSKETSFVDSYFLNSMVGLGPDNEDYYRAMALLSKQFQWTKALVLHDIDPSLTLPTVEGFSGVLDYTGDAFPSMAHIEAQGARIIISLINCQDLLKREEFAMSLRKGFVWILKSTAGCDLGMLPTKNVFSVEQNTCVGEKCTEFNKYMQSKMQAGASTDYSGASFKEMHLMWDAVYMANEVGQTNTAADVAAGVSKVSFVGVSGQLSFQGMSRNAFAWHINKYNGTGLSKVGQSSADYQAMDIDAQLMAWDDGVAPSSNWSNTDDDSVFTPGVIVGIAAGAVLVIVILGVLIKTNKFKCPVGGFNSKKGRLMISYAHVDKEFAFKLQKYLESAGFNVWIDTSIVPGEDWRDNIARAIEKSEAVVFCCSPKSVTSKYCKEELYYALNLPDCAIFPVVCEDCWSHLKGGVKMCLQRYQMIMFNENPFDESAAKLVSNIRSHDRRKDKTHNHRSKGKVEKKTVASMKNNVTSTSSLKFSAENVVKPADVYLCYDSSGPDAVCYAAFAAKLGYAFRNSGVSVQLSARKEIQRMDFDRAVAEFEDIKAAKRAAEQKQKSEENGEPNVKEVEDKDGTVVEDMTSLPGSPQEKEPLLNNKRSNIARRRGQTDAGPVDTLVQRLSRKEAARRLLFREEATDHCDDVDTFEINSLQIDSSKIMVLLLSPEATASGEIVDELHYTYEQSLKIIIVKCYAGKRRVDMRTDKKKDDHKTGSVGIMLQEAIANEIDFGSVEPHLGWVRKEPDSFPFDILLLDVKAQLIKAMKDTRMEQEYGVTADNALLNEGGDKAATSKNLVRLKKAGLV